MAISSAERRKGRARRLDINSSGVLTGEGKDRRDCMRQFRAAWDRFAADEANLTEFLNAKRGGATE